MSKNLITDKMLENAHKITYLISVYPEHTIADIIDLMQIPAIQTNAAIFAAQDLGYISKPDDKTGIITLLSPPEPYKFGEFEEELEAHLIYCFDKIGQREKDIEEHDFAKWVTGYGAHDVTIAVKRLLNSFKIWEYKIEDTEFEKGKEGAVNVYTFYTAYKNREHQWGRKTHFKKPPVAPKKAKQE